MRGSPRRTTALGRRAATAVLSKRRRPAPRTRRLAGLWKYLAVVGPGLIVANAGNDAGGVFTYANTGAKYGLTLLWVFIPILVALIVTQEMVGRLGCVTGKGLMDLIRERFGVKWTLFASVIVLVANGGTVLAEFAGVAAGLSLLGVAQTVSVVASAVLVGVLVLRANRRLVERVFLALGLAFFSYIVTAFTVHPQWGMIGNHLVVPHFDRPGGVSAGMFVTDIIALIGTSITPYMQLYLQSAIVDKGTPETELRYVRADIVSGSIFAVVVAVFIVITTASTIFGDALPQHPHGLQGVGINGAGSNGAAEAARALAPLVGNYAKDFFAVGLLGASLLAAAVLPLSTAFVVCEAFGAERSVQRHFREAPLFFTLFLGLIAAAAGAVLFIPGPSLAGVAIATQALDGMLLPILLVFIIILANDRRLLGKRRNGRAYNAIAGGLVAVMSVLTAILVATTLFPGLAN